MTLTRSPTRLSGLTALIANGRWAIRPEQLRDIVTGFSAYLQGRPAGDAALDQVREARTRQAEVTAQAQEQAPGVAVLSLHGTIFPRGSLMVDLCGAVDAHTLAARLREAAADPAVASIVLDVDSGGGAVSGVDVAAQAVRDAAAVKRVTAVANTMMCSAALWIASGASEIVVTPAGEVGSIGVIATHTDETAALEGEGLKVTYVRSTDRKALGQPAEALEGPALAMWQGELDRLHELFVADVAAGREVTAATARKWATGDVWFGQEAVDVGLADSVGTLDSVLTDHLTAAAPAPAPPSLRSGKASAEDPAQEAPVLITVKDRTGKTHTIDTESEAEAQVTVSGLEQAAHAAGSQAEREAVAAALGLTPAELTPERLGELRDAAANGAKYRADLEEQVGTLAVSVYGADRAAAIDRVTRLAKKADLDDLRGMVDDLTAQKSAAFPAGRQSAQDTGTALEEAKPAPKRPARAFDF